MSTDLSKLTGDYTIDPAHSRLGFVARHAMVTKVRGSFTDFEGTAHIDSENPAKSNVSISIQVASIDTANEQRDGHLRTNDFFSVDQFPKIEFKSTSIEHDSSDDYKVTGDLTIRGVTKSVTLGLEFTGAAQDPFGNERIGFEGSLDINRKDWGISFNTPLETGGVLVSEKVKLEVDISAIKQA